METIMALFMIERNFAAALHASEEDLKAIIEINTLAGVKWLHSFLSADKRKTYVFMKPKTVMPSGRPLDVPGFLQMLSSSSPANCVLKRCRLHHDVAPGAADATPR
jgi:hypothetical protein